MARPGRRVAALLAAVGASVCLTTSAATPLKGLTEARLVGAAMDEAYNADFAAVEPALARACGPAPPPACEVARAAARWWQIVLDPENRSLDQAFIGRVESAISAAERWTAQEPQRAEAWFYLGAAYGVRVQFRSWRKAYVSAALDGKRAKQSLERALAIDPALHDAHFGIGLYRYYADIAPAVLRFLRWLLALPGGDRVTGLQQMERTRTTGTLMRTEADYQVYLLSIWYEHQPDRALARLAELRARHPRNPLFVVNTAQVAAVYTHDHPAALAAYRALVAGAHDGSLHEPALATVWGRCGIAQQLDALAETDRAVEEWQAVIAAKPTAPYGVLALSSLELGQALDRLGRREPAVAAYRAALAAVPPGDPDGVRDRASSGIRTAPDRASAEAYRRSIEGWRALQRHSLDDAGVAFGDALRVRPDDGVTLYRRGQWHLARGDQSKALADFERVTQVRPLPPAPFVASSQLDAGHLYLAAGDRARAAARYDAAARVSGADPETRDAARRACAAIR
jgi:tetratricopeptide (TPR) repeat protein